MKLMAATNSSAATVVQERTQSPRFHGGDVGSGHRLLGLSPEIYAE